MRVEVFECNPFCENTYVLYDESSKEAVIIDCGCYTQNEKIQLETFVEKNSLNVKYLLNTHLHLDHVFGNVFCTKKYGILPLAHQEDEVLIENFEQQLALFGLQAPDGVQNLGGYLKEDDALVIGDETIRILHVPGHSQGSLCFYLPASKMIFVGDVLFKQSIGRTDLLGGNYAQLIDGITNKLLVLPDETVVYSGHGEATQIGYEKRYNPYL